jgi:hypothetical protein
MRIMRTTIAIGDRLLESAKREARRRGLTLGRLVEEALRRELASSARPDRPVRVPVFHGEGGVRAGIDVTSNRALLEALDEGLPLERIR